MLKWIVFDFSWCNPWHHCLKCKCKSRQHPEQSPAELKKIYSFGVIAMRYETVQRRCGNYQKSITTRHILQIHAQFNHFPSAYDINVEIWTLNNCDSTVTADTASWFLLNFNFSFGFHLLNFIFVFVSLFPFPLYFILFYLFFATAFF